MITTKKYLNNAPTNIANDNELNGERYEQVQNLKYLGSIVTANNDMIKKINEKLTSGNRCLRALNKMIISRHIFNKIKIRFYKSIIKHIVVYGSASWTLTEETIARVSTLKKKGKGIPITGHEVPRGMWMQGSTYSQPRH